MSDSPYRERILAHSKAPHNRGPLESCDAEATLHNPLCGDRVTIQLALRDGAIDDARFEARGCAIAVASASMLTTRVRAARIEQAEALARQLIEAVQRGGSAAGFDEDLAALATLHPHRARRRCATLAWEALIAALGDG